MEAIGVIQRTDNRSIGNCSCGSNRWSIFQILTKHESSEESSLDLDSTPLVHSYYPALPHAAAGYSILFLMSDRNAQMQMAKI